ncbi:MAG TPA: hypothetical protein VGL86_19690 [Polyangia bacterium]
MPGHRQVVLGLSVALFVAGFLLYAPSLRYGHVEYDDVRILYDHSALYDEHSLAHSLREIFVGYYPREEPLVVRDVTWALDSRIFGFQSAFGHHFGNVLLNAANGTLLFLFLVAATRRLYFAAVVAAAWIVLPVHVEPVCWLMGRKDVLCAFFALAALCVEARALDAPEQSPTRPLGLRVASVVLCTLAVFSKISAVTLVGVICAFRVLGPKLRARDAAPASVARAVVGVVPHLVVSVAAYAWYNRVLHQFGVLHPSTTPLGTRVADLLLYGPLALGGYLGGMLGLSDGSIIYAWPDAAIALDGAAIVSSIAIVLALVAFAFFIARRRRELGFWVVAFVLLMLPYMHFVEVIRWRADRYVYLASFCVLALVVELAGGLVARARPALRRVLFGAVAAWALVAVFVTLASSPRFADDRALWTWEVALARPAPAAFVSLASSYVAEGRATKDAAARLRLAESAERVARAGEDYYRSVPWRRDRAPKRDLANLEVQLGQAAALRGEPIAAQLAHYEASYRIEPTDANVLFLAQALLVRAATDGHDVALARQSLALYSERLALRSADAARRAFDARVLDAYRRSFPELAPDIDAVERRWRR